MFRLNKNQENQPVIFKHLNTGWKRLKLSNKSIYTTHLAYLNLVLTIALFLTANNSYSKVSQKEVVKLTGSLTPVGATRAGNAEGTIPDWNGGIRFPPPDYVPGGNYIDPFSSDLVEKTITPADLDTNISEKLSEGHKELFKLYGNYKMPIYPTRRSASYSPLIYEAIKTNAYTAELLPRSAGVKNGQISSPFPIPKSAEEILWNHMLRYRGKRISFRNASAAVTQSGKFTPIVTDRKFFVIYAQPELDSRKLENKFFFLKFRTISPPRNAGNISLIHESIDQVASPRKAWQYFAGQRRLRRSPNLAYDSYTSESNGLRTVDQFDMFNGAPDQYEWKIVGKREIYVPYNAYKLDDQAISVNDIIKENHINQDLTRYELHRTWVIEGKLRVGIQHIYSRRVLYVDEDSWQVLLTEEYDKKGKLWRFQEGHAINFYDQPFVSTALETVYDLQSGRYFVDGINNEFAAHKFESDMSPKEFSTSAVRREARR